jgi:hypothetical protein
MMIDRFFMPLPAKPKCRQKGSPHFARLVSPPGFPSAQSRKMSKANERRLIFLLVPWAVAACLGLAAAQMAKLYLALRAENIALRDQAELADIERKSADNQLEAERILAARELADARSALTQANEQIRELGRPSQP